MYDILLKSNCIVYNSVIVISACTLFNDVVKPVKKVLKLIPWWSIWRFVRQVVVRCGGAESHVREHDTKLDGHCWDEAAGGENLSILCELLKSFWLFLFHRWGCFSKLIIIFFYPHKVNRTKKSMIYRLQRDKIVKFMPRAFSISIFYENKKYLI